MKPKENKPALHVVNPGATEGPVLDVRGQVLALIESKQASQAEVAREAGMSSSAVSRWLKGEYPGDNAAQEEKLRLWLDQRARQTTFDMPEGPGFIPTRTAERVIAALSYGQMAGDLVVAHGPAGIGKSEAISHYMETRPNVWVGTMAPTMSSARACLEEVLYALGVRETRGISSASMQRLAISRVEGKRGLIVVDEAQHLSLPALETLRAVHDAAKVGLALVGNEHVYARLTGNGKTALFAQLHSRIGRRESLRKPPVSDVDALAQGWGVSGKEAVEFLRRIAATPGALRQVVKTLRLASSFARSGGETLDIAHLHKAWRDLGGEHRSEG